MPRWKGRWSAGRGSPVRHNPADGIMTQFMELGPVPVDGLEIRFLRRHLDEVMRRGIERHVAANPDIRAGGGDDGLDMRQHIGSARKRRRVGVGGQPVALVDMEDGEPLEEADASGLFA